MFLQQAQSGKSIGYAGAAVIAVLGLYASSLHSYLLFHSLVEFATLAIAFALFTLTWNTRRFQTTGCLKIIGIGYGLIAVIDLVHTMAYKGMGIFPGYGANLPTQLWIAARALQALLLCVAPLYARRNVDERIFFGIACVVTVATTVLVGAGYFPDCFIDGKGLTPFKITSEYVISAVLIGALGLFFLVRTSFNSHVFTLVVCSIICTIGSELAFTSYISVYGPANMTGHILKLAAFALTYRALVVTGLWEPFDLIFHDLKQAEQELRRHRDKLEELVQERTMALEAEVAEHKRAEEKLFRLNRELKAISSCNLALMKVEDEESLLAEICRIVCGEAGYCMAWVGYAGNDEQKSVRPVAWAGQVHDYLDNINVTWADTERGHGPTGTAIRTGGIVYNQDFSADPRLTPWREAALSRGYRSSIALPLKGEPGESFGALTIYSSGINDFTPDEIRLLDELAGDISFGIRSLRNRKARMAAEEELRLKTVELEQEVAERLVAQDNLQEKTIQLEEEIEERRRVQDALEHLNEGLEQRVKERTAELEAKNADQERMLKAFVGRELRMVELKKRIKELEAHKR
jgi:GAF domain-containing protein